MNPFTVEHLVNFWSTTVVGANLVILMNLLGALALGALVGYERTYRSRAAGMRTYGLVCMAAAALMVICGYPTFWYGGQLTRLPGFLEHDPTRVIQGIVTGIGFLGAGVIMKDSFQISGLTTAASIWVVAAIGILVGVGLYPAAILLSAVSTAFMMWGARLEAHFPSELALVVVVKFGSTSPTAEDDLRRFLAGFGFILARNTVSITVQADGAEWRFVAVGRDRRRCATLTELARNLGKLPDVRQLQLSHARN